MRRPGFLGLNLTNGAAVPRVLAEGFRATDKLSKRPTGGGIGTFCTGSAAAVVAAEEGSVTGAGLSVGFSGGVVGSPEMEAGLLGVATPRLATGRGFAFNFGGIMSNVGKEMGELGLRFAKCKSGPWGKFVLEGRVTLIRNIQASQSAKSFLSLHPL